MTKELLFSITKKDFQITFFNGTGKGGQNRNKTENCVRIKHIETGITAVGKDERSRAQNLKNAFIRLVNKKEFKDWLRVKIAEVTSDKKKVEEEINKKVDESMKEENLKIEILNHLD